MGLTDIPNMSPIILHHEHENSADASVRVSPLTLCMGLDGEGRLVPFISGSVTDANGELGFRMRVRKHGDQYAPEEVRYDHIADIDRQRTLTAFVIGALESMDIMVQVAELSGQIEAMVQLEKARESRNLGSIGVGSGGLMVTMLDGADHVKVQGLMPLTNHRGGTTEMYFGAEFRRTEDGEWLRTSKLEAHIPRMGRSPIPSDVRREATAQFESEVPSRLEENFQRYVEVEREALGSLHAATRALAEHRDREISERLVALEKFGERTHDLAQAGLSY